VAFDAFLELEYGAFDTDLEFETGDDRITDNDRLAVVD
jgi:hypothetical protein